jgi:hypothetical protein
MATVNVKFFRPHTLAGTVAVYGQDIIPPETYTSSATSQSTSAAPDKDTYVRVTAIGGDVWIAIGKAPLTAVTEQGTLILEGIPEVFKIEKNEVLAIID